MNDSLVALACGDSYGSYFEMEGLMGVKFDINLLPDIPIEKRVTDDTKMATILYKHYNRYKRLETDILFNEYKRWAIDEGYKDGIGIHTADVLLNNKKNKDSQGNGALMRVIPFGIALIQDGYSFDDAVDLMDEDSALTHANETIFLSNRLALDLALNGLSALEKPIYKSFLSNFRAGNTAWVLHSLYIVIETLKKDLSFVEGFKYIVSKGGDTDTNCAIYGAIKGYKNRIVDEVNIQDFIS